MPLIWKLALLFWSQLVWSATLFQTDPEDEPQWLFDPLRFHLVKQEIIMFNKWTDWRKIHGISTGWIAVKFVRDCWLSAFSLLHVQYLDLDLDYFYFLLVKLWWKKKKKINLPNQPCSVWLYAPFEKKFKLLHSSERRKKEICNGFVNQNYVSPQSQISVCGLTT